MSDTVKEQVLERASMLLEAKVTDPGANIHVQFDVEEAAMKVLAELHEPEVVILAHELSLAVLPQHERDEPRKLEGWYLGIAASMAERFLIQNPNCLPSPEQREARRKAALSDLAPVMPDVIQKVQTQLISRTNRAFNHTLDELVKAIEHVLRSTGFNSHKLAHLATECGIRASASSLETAEARRGLVSLILDDVKSRYLTVHGDSIDY